MTGPRGGWPAALGVAALAGAASLALPGHARLRRVGVDGVGAPARPPRPRHHRRPVVQAAAGPGPRAAVGPRRRDARGVDGAHARGRGALARCSPTGSARAWPGRWPARSPRSASALSADLYRTALLGSAEPVLIALTLGAADRHLAGRRDWALVLDRRWPGSSAPRRGSCSGLYGVFVWLREPAPAPARRGGRRAAARRCGSAWTGSARATRCTRSSTATSATEGSAANASVPAFEVVRRAADAVILPTLVLAAVGVVFAVAPPRPRGAVARRARAGLDRGGGDHGRGRLHRHPALPGRAGGGAVRRGRRRARVAAGRRPRAPRPHRAGGRDRRPGARARAAARPRGRAHAQRRAQPGRPARRAARARWTAPAAAPRCCAPGAPRSTRGCRRRSAWELDVPLSGVQATWSSSRRHPHWAPPALVFRAPARLAGPRPALPAGVRRRRRDPLGTLAGAARRGVSRAQALPWRRMELVEERPNVELRRGPDGRSIVVLSFPYDPQIVAVVRSIPQRRFDWDTREWWAPVDDWAGVHVAEVLDRFPELTTSAQVDAWLAAIERRWVGRVTTTRHDGRGWWVLRTRAGTVPEALLEGAIEREDGALLAPLTARGRRGARRARGGTRMDGAARRCIASLERGEDPPRRAPGRQRDRRRDLPAPRRALGPRRRRRLRRPARRRSAPATRCPSTPGSSRRSTPSWPCTTSPSTASAKETLAELRAEYDEALERDPRLARDDRRADRRDRRRARRRARALPVGGRALRAARAARLPGRRAGPGQDGRGAGGARGRRRLSRPSSSAPPR